MNKIYLIGNASRDAELRTSATGNQFATFSLAVTRKFAQDGADNVDWFNCIAFGNFAEKVVAKFVKKGTKLAVIGRLEFSTGTDGKQYASVMIEDMELCGNKTQNNIENPSNVNDVLLTPADDNDLPF